MSVVVELRGGPLDGSQVALDALPWSPPLTLRFPEVPFVSVCGVRDVPWPWLVVTVHVYDRHPSPAETGPVWRYLYRRLE